MQRAITIADETAAGVPLKRILLELQSWEISLRGLIRTRVRFEVSSFNRDRSVEYEGLVPQKPGQSFSLSVPGKDDIDEEEECQRAEEAFLRNGFMVIVKGRQIEELDEMVQLDRQSDVRFIRLIQLKGG